MKEGTSKKLVGFFAVFCLMMLAIHLSESQTRKPSQVLDMLKNPELSVGMDDILEMGDSVASPETAVLVDEDAKKL